MLNSRNLLGAKVPPVCCLSKKRSQGQRQEEEEVIPDLKKLQSAVES